MRPPHWGALSGTDVMAIVTETFARCKSEQPGVEAEAKHVCE